MQGEKILRIFKKKPTESMQRQNTTAESKVFEITRGFYTESYFREMLNLERKRTERSKNPFILMLIETDLLHNGRNKRLYSNRFAEMLQTGTRDIDIKGWYEQDTIIGVIFTETNMESQQTLILKMRDSISATFSSGAAQEVPITCIAFPEDREWLDKNDVVADSRLYPQLNQRSKMRTTAQVLKRAIDIACSLVAIIAFSPLLLTIPVLIKLDSKGPVLFKQKRVGKGGKIFSFVKYRSMHINNDTSAHQKFMKEFITGSMGEEKKGDVSFKMKNDPRITRIGRFLRSSSLDELPQLFAVLAGTMSLVGPRPPIPYEVREYDIWHRRRVLDVKPGITGKWQIEGRSRTPFTEMCRMDIQYAENWSLYTDLKLILKTPAAVLIARGAC